MPDYLLPCSCGQKVRVANAQAGGSVLCVCGQRLTVPTLRGLRSLEPAPPLATKGPAGWSHIHGYIFATALVIAGAGVAIVAYQGWQYLRVVPFTKDYSPEVIQAEAEHISKLTPEQTLEHWDKILEEGLGPKDPYIWTRAEAAAKGLRWWMLMGNGLIAAGAIVATITIFVGRRRS